MNYSEIENLINLVNASRIEEFNYENNGVKINIKTQQNKKIKEHLISTSNTDVATDVQEMPKNLSEIKSPIVGVFYASPSPDEQPFVESGQKVKKGDVVCIVEAMKVMNEIKAKKDGIIKKILVENEEVVEYGQPLFLVE